MNLSLEELNELMWYRATKVVYFFSYAIALSVLIFLLIDTYSYEIPANLPNSFNEAIQDNNFYNLSSPEMTSILKEISPEFTGLPEIEQRKVITRLFHERDKNKKGKANFTYFPRTEFSSTKALYFALIYTLITVVAIESIRRCFYYVVVGQLFPVKKQELVGRTQPKVVRRIKHI